MSVSREFKFSAAHYLNGDEAGKCRHMHGHNYTLIVTVTGDVDGESGMVINFSELKARIKPLIEQLDHASLNDILDENPTAENILNWIADKLAWTSFGASYVSKLVLWETDNCFATMEFEK